MLRAVLLFLLIVLAGANFALYRYGREPAASSTMDAAATTPAAASSPSGATSPASTSTSTSTKPAPASAPRNVPASPPAASTQVTAGASALLIPVQGVTAAQLDDTFSDARAQGRVHEAIDIMAPRGTPVLAVADGTVEKLFDSVPGGLTIYQFEPSGRYAYYYAHLDRYADGLGEKQAIRRGQVIGYVGSTGNADPFAPHLHFAIFVLGPERQWWKGTAINPYPVLKGGG